MRVEGLQRSLGRASSALGEAVCTSMGMVGKRSGGTDEGQGQAGVGCRARTRLSMRNARGAALRLRVGAAARRQAALCRRGRQ